METINILFLSSDGYPSSDVKEQLHKESVNLEEVHSFDRAVKELQSKTYHVCIQRCIHLEEDRGKFISSVKNSCPNIPVLVIGKNGNIESVVRLMKAGASDVAVLPYLDDAFVNLVLRTVKSNVVENSVSVETAESMKWNVDLIGESLAIKEVRSAIDLVANSQTAVLITGESGTGKEVVARMIHMKSSRAKQPFVALNCAALPKDIIENELFGHENGAFTGALKKKIGSFESADGGTMFFDEIAEMNPDTQAKLLRVLEQKSFHRLGGEKEVHVDVRTIGATNKKIQAALKSGEFRQDLYYRFSVIEINLPPLRERKEDVLLLIDHFLASFKQKYNRPEKYIRKDVIGQLTEYSWPGNVRELRNVIERAVVISANEMIVSEDLPQSITQKKPVSSVVSIPLGTSCEQAEQLLIMRTLDHVRNNKSKAAKILGLSRKTLHTKLKNFSEK